MSIANVTIQVAGKLKTVDEYTRGKAIKQFCRDCMCGVTAEVRNCSAPLCPLYAFRPFQAKDTDDDTADTATPDPQD